MAIKRCIVLNKIAVRPSDGKICWIAGPAPGPVSDLKMLKKSGLLSKLNNNELILGDKIYSSKGNFEIQTMII